jgi:hypothetical protein
MRESVQIVFDTDICPNSDTLSRGLFKSLWRQWPSLYLLMLSRSEFSDFFRYPGYGIEPEDNGHDWSHFTQIVWKGSTSVGCFTKICDHLDSVRDGVPPWFTVCNYYPIGKSALSRFVALLIGQGNWLGEYAENVLPPDRKLSTVRINRS